MTLAQLLALDPAAMLDALPRERQMAIVVPLLLSEFAAVTAQDDGTDASPQDQETAAGIEHRNFDAAMNAIEAAFPEILGDDFTALRDGPTVEMIDGEGTVRVNGFDAPRKLYSTRALGLHVRIGGAKVGIVGFKNSPPRTRRSGKPGRGSMSMPSGCGGGRSRPSGRAYRPLRR